jgi:hypothetical protein
MQRMQRVSPQVTLREVDTPFRLDGDRVKNQQFQSPSTCLGSSNAAKRE